MIEPRTLAVLTSADVPKPIICCCGRELARVSVAGVEGGVYPLADVRAWVERGRMTMVCPECHEHTRLTVARRVA
jgi:hypothetical protein